jgi:steroid delta-isomerase-like uncharacterized protein
VDLEENKAVIRRLTERIWNGRDPAAVDELFAADCVGWRAGRPVLQGIDAVRRFVAGLEATLGDSRWTVEDVIAEGDRVVTRWTGQGTHAGEVQGVPATGRPFTITGITVHRIADGKIAEMWTAEDWLGMLRQVGATLTPPESGAR